MMSESEPTVERAERLTRHPALPKANSMWQWQQFVPWWRVLWQFGVIAACRYCPSLRIKNALYRALGVKVGAKASVGLGATMDMFFPRLISIGENSIVGFNTIVLTHEFLVKELRTGPVEIGKNVMIGANCTILPGVSIGDGAVISACSLVNRDIPPGVLAGGVPVRVLAEDD